MESFSRNISDALESIKIIVKSLSIFKVFVLIFIALLSIEITTNFFYFYDIQERLDLLERIQSSVQDENTKAYIELEYDKIVKELSARGVKNVEANSIGLLKQTVQEIYSGISFFYQNIENVVLEVLSVVGMLVKVILLIILYLIIGIALIICFIGALLGFIGDCIISLFTWSWITTLSQTLFRICGVLIDTFEQVGNSFFP